jgi:site-specific recombinase XerC
MKDVIVEEVRRHRMEHTRTFGGDLLKICADLRSVQDISGHRIVRLTRERLEPERTSGTQIGEQS